MARRIAISVYVDAQQLAELRDLSAASLVPVAALIRLGVDAVLKDALPVAPAAGLPAVE